MGSRCGEWVESGWGVGVGSGWRVGGVAVWGVGGEWVGWRLGTLCVEWGTLCAGLPHAEGMGKGSSVCVCM